MRLRIYKSSGLIILIFLVVIILHYSGPLRPLENLLVKILNPVGTGIYHLGQKIQILWKNEVSMNDYNKLQEERNQLIVKNVELQILEQENQELREALSFVKENQYKFLIANVIGRDQSSSNYFILNKGTEDGVKNNFPVVSPTGILVGKIVKAEDRVSVMLIPTDTNFKTAGVILNKSPHLPAGHSISREGYSIPSSPQQDSEGRGDKSKGNTSGLVRGERGLSIKMEFIPQDEEIEKDDVIITSGIELNMPKGLVIGRVSEIKKETRGVFSEAVLNPLLSYEDLNIVMIFLPQN